MKVVFSYSRSHSTQENLVMQEIPVVTQDNLVMYPRWMTTIHERIAAYRRRKELSLEGLAALVGVSWQTVQQWENGKTAPKRQRMEQVAEALGVTVNELALGSGHEDVHARQRSKKVVPLPDRNPPVIDEVIKLMLSMNDSGRDRLAGMARALAEQFPRDKKGKTSFQ